MATFYTDNHSPSTFALRAVELASGGDVIAHRDPAYVTAANPSNERRVALVSGGGAGHEPMHANFVGGGGLDAAVPGEVFTSPHSRQIHEACAAVAKDGGVLQIVKNYTGDRINFAIARETLEAEGIRVAEVVVDDDLGSDTPASHSGEADADNASQSRGPGRRGTGATVIVEKILGAAADRGLDLHQLRDMGMAIVAASRSIAVARAAHTPPGQDEPAFLVESGTLEYGVGIHGEAAREQLRQPRLNALVDRMVDDILPSLENQSQGTIVLVNGLGGLAPLELAHISAEVERALRERDVQIRSLVAGSYVTALDMAGFSLTVTALQNESWYEDWCAAHRTVGLPTPRPYVPSAGERAGATYEPPASGSVASDTSAEPSPWLSGFIAQFDTLKDPLNAMDQKAGDGDVGTNLAGAAAAARRYAQGANATLAQDLRALTRAFLSDTGGSSGPLFGLVMQDITAAAESGAALLDGVRQGQEAVSRVGGAKPGDRTIVDALDAAVKGSQALDAAAVDAATAGAEATASMVGGKGRSSYLGDRVLGTPDPGALAMAYLLLMVAEGANGVALDQQRRVLDDLLAN